MLPRAAVLNCIEFADIVDVSEGVVGYRVESMIYDNS